MTNKMKNNKAEAAWEKPVIHKVLLTQVTEAGTLKGNDGGGTETGNAETATS
jgi:hypothetical protein